MKEGPRLVIGDRIAQVSHFHLALCVTLAVNATTVSGLSKSTHYTTPKLATTCSSTLHHHSGHKPLNSHNPPTSISTSNYQRLQPPRPTTTYNNHTTTSYLPHIHRAILFFAISLAFPVDRRRSVNHSSHFRHGTSSLPLRRHLRHDLLSAQPRQSARSFLRV
jgi:hypothetical protein